MKRILDTYTSYYQAYTTEKKPTRRQVDNIPSELITRIGTFLDFTSLEATSKTNRRWRNGILLIKHIKLNLHHHLQHSIPFLQNFIALQSLEIKSTSTKKLDFLGHLRNLHQLKLRISIITGDNELIELASSLKKLTVLRALDLSSGFIANVITHLKDLPLQNLTLANAPIGSSDGASMLHKSLKTLTFIGCNICDLDIFQYCTDLEQLNLKFCNIISKNRLNFLSRLTMLQLNLSRSYVRVKDTEKQLELSNLDQADEQIQNRPGDMCLFFEKRST